MSTATHSSYQETGYFSKLIIDYLNQHPDLKELYGRFPTIENFEAQILEKQQNFDPTTREILVSEIQNQYQSVIASESTNRNINLLKNKNTYTVTTGHQLALFTGPLYFLYKICATINLTKTLKENYPNYDFVPIFWMASEDHDFDEVNFFNFKNKKITWNQSVKGPVGRQSTRELNAVFEILKSELKGGDNAKYIESLFTTSYLAQDNLAKATHYLVNELFGKEGLVILDADARSLKKVFAPYIKKELLEQKSFAKVNEVSQKLARYTIQVNPREINLFYIQNDLRERIVFEQNGYKVNNTNIQFTEKELVEELESKPENFSPNVILRPLYQEVILPNLCYIGGGGELAYWLQLKSNFENNKVTFPMLLLRNSALLVTQKQQDKIEKLKLKHADLFLKTNDLVNQKTKELSSFPIDLSPQKEALHIQFDYLYQLVNQTDASFAGAVKAQEVKQIKGLENLEKRLLKAQKRKLAADLNRITTLQNELFPNGSLQERTNNFSELYLDYGEEFIPKLLKHLQPLEQAFTIIQF
jgi:bacillithiol synthase